MVIGLQEAKSWGKRVSILCMDTKMDKHELNRTHATTGSDPGPVDTSNEGGEIGDDYSLFLDMHLGYDGGVNYGVSRGTVTVTCEVL